MFAGQPFQAIAIQNTLGGWEAPGIDSETRHHFSRNTCNGCHNGVETGAPFSQFLPRAAGAEAGLSGFLTGTTVLDPVTLEPRTFNDLARRNADLKAIVCPSHRLPASRPFLRAGPPAQKASRGSTELQRR